MWLAAGLGGLFLSLWGCSQESQIPIASVAPAPRPSPEPSGALAHAVKAASLAVEAVGKDNIYKLSFSEAAKAQLIDKLAPSTAAVKQALDGPFVYQPDPSGSQDEKPHHAGWIWCFRRLEWQTERAIKAQDWGAAAEAVSTGLRFGARIASGDASDASLGFSGAERLTLLAAPHLSLMLAGDLETLSAGAQLAVQDLASPETTLSHELDRARMEIQDLQEAWKSGQNFAGVLGTKSTSDAYNWLKGHRSRANDFFQGFAAEVDQLSADYRKMAGGGVEVTDPTSPKDPRWKDPATKKARWRPWRDMTPRILAGHAVYVDQRLLFLARTRMLALTAAIEARKQRSGRAPRDLSRMPDSLRKDPYTGEDLSYQAGALQYRLWSTGPDRIDDGGMVETGPMARDFGLLTRSAH